MSVFLLGKPRLSFHFLTAVKLEPWTNSYSRAPNPAIDSPQLLITKRLGNSVTIPPGGLKSSDAYCQLDERITGGGYGSSSPGVRAKDVQIVQLRRRKRKVEG